MNLKLPPEPNHKVEELLENLDHKIERFSVLNLGGKVWAIFDIESAFEENGEAYVGCWSGEADDAEMAVTLAKSAWGIA